MISSNMIGFLRRYSTKTKSVMFEFKSIVVIDLETTGLPGQEKNKTKVTELAMIACERQHCETAVSLPRVLHKVVFCINPDRTISSFASRLSGLHNQLLENTSTFEDTTASIMKDFIERLPQPVCLIAHNGNNFDFPILKTELLRCSVSMPENLHCTDSLRAFREIFTQKKPGVHSFGSEEDDRVCLQALRQYEATTPPVTPQKVDMVTAVSPNNMRACRNLGDSFNMMPPERQLSIEAMQDGLGQIEPAIWKKGTFQGRPRDYKLKTVYQFLHNQDFEDAHRAEADAVALLSCIVKCGPMFFTWLDENAILWNTVRPLL